MATALKVNGRTPEARAFRSERAVKATRELANAGGYDAVQMRDVARIAQTALSTLYKYYPSKDDLISAAVASELGALGDDLRRNPPRQRTPAGRAGEVYVRMFYAMVRSPGFAHAVMTVYSAPKQFDLHRFEKDPDSTGEGLRGREFVDLVAAQAWGPDHRLIATQLRALRMIETLWAGSVIEWHNGDMAESEAERRLRFGTKKLLISSQP